MKDRSFLPTVARGLLLVGAASLSACGGDDDDGPGSAPQDVNTSIGVAITGLFSGNTLALQNNGGDNLNVTADGTSFFNATMPGGSRYNVTILAQPSGQTCAVADGSGTATGSNVTVTVTCSPNEYNIGGTVSGLSSGRSLILRDEAAGEVTLSANGEFGLPATLASRSSYAVTVTTQPQSQHCTVTNGSGMVIAENVADITVACTTVTYAVGVTVRGLASTAGLVLQNNGTDDLAVPESGRFTFATRIEDASTYDVSILSQPAGKTCFVTNGTGMVNGADVNITVTCPWHVAYLAYSDGRLTGAYIDEKAGFLFGTDSFPVISLPNLRTIELSPDAKFLYAGTSAAAGTVTDTLSVYAVDSGTGTLSVIQGSPYTAAGAGSIAVEPTGRFVYAAGNGSISGFSIDSISGTLTAIPGNPFMGGVNATIEAEPRGKFIYAVNHTGTFGAGELVGFRIDSSTGALTAVPGDPLSTGGVGSGDAAFDPEGRFVYVTNLRSDNVAGFSIDAMTGSLTPISGSPFDARFRPSSIVVEPTGRFAYIAGGDGLCLFAVDSDTGFLSHLPPTPPSPTNDCSPGAAGTFLDPSARFIYDFGGFARPLDPVTGAVGALVPVNIPQPGFRTMVIAALP
jgi:6-phosphogluconolactonase (cycloisomerase 2 family)